VRFDSARQQSHGPCLWNKSGSVQGEVAVTCQERGIFRRQNTLITLREKAWAFRGAPRHYAKPRVIPGEKFQSWTLPSLPADLLRDWEVAGDLLIHTYSIFGKLQGDGKFLPSERTGKCWSQCNWGRSPSEKHHANSIAPSG